MATTTFGACVTIVAKTTAPTDGGTVGPGAVTPYTSGTPVPVGEGGTNQPVGELLIVDDGNATNCFTAGQQLTISFTAGMNNLQLDPTDLTVYDFVSGSVNSSGLALSASFTNSFGAGGARVTVITINVLRTGTAGNPTLGTTGSGILLHGLSFDVSTIPVGHFLNANLTTTLSSVVTAQPVALAVVVPPGPLVISPSSLDFGNQDVNTTSLGQDITLTNSGLVPILIANIKTTGAFAQQNTCGASIAVAASCTITATFSPSAAATYNGSIVITDNTPGTIHMVPLTGVGVLTGTRLLFPFVSSVGGFDTGLVVANTCADQGVFSATSTCASITNSSGPVRYFFFGTDPTTHAQVTGIVSSDIFNGGEDLSTVCRGFDFSGSVAAGQITACPVSALLPLMTNPPAGFEGYVIAVTSFAYGKGIATHFNSAGLPYGVTGGLVLPNTARTF